MNDVPTPVVPQPGPRLPAGTLSGIVGLLVATGLLWVLEALDYVLPGDMDALGIVPRDVDGLTGIVLAPFLHAGFDHLAANTVPLLVLGILAALRGPVKFVVATAVIVLVSGVGVWLTAPGYSVTVGASGVVFGYFGYVLGRGLFDRRLLDIAVAAVVVLVYGSIVWGVLPGQAGVSWQGHLFGLVGGVLAAWMLRGARKAPAGV
ncbi:MAG TPA: rhomboid family intramembrane serine protease [Phytomonospora sp.]